VIPYEDVRALILAACAPLQPRAVSLADALGCVTSIPLQADEAVPPFANTAMDGYAVRAADTAGAPARLKVVATLAAGAASDRDVGAGEAVRIMTGAPIPSGADAIVIVELTHSDDDGATVVVEREAQPGDHVRPAGDDIAAGDIVVAAGTELGPAHLGVLASVGYQRVPVYPRARVGVLTTGDEVVDGPAPLQPGQIRDSNRPMLLALVAQSGFDAIDLGRARDDIDVIEAAVTDAAARCDAVVTTGGVSVGDFDHVKAVLAKLGRFESWQVAIKPAKPLAFAVIGGRPVFGLPGNPVSAMVSFELFARPALRQMTGHRDVERPQVVAIADDGLRRHPDGKVHFVRVVASHGDDGRVHVRAAGAQGSHQLHATAAANALAIVPDGEGIEPRAEVRAVLLQA
jgi:molybdenum cofactor synthesis domain-containing protein